MSVGTAGELSACLQALRERRGYSYADLDRAARALPQQAGRLRALPRSTLSDVVNGKALPTKELLLTFLAACHVAREDIPQWLAALERARSSRVPRDSRTIRVADVSPRILGVHASISLDGGSGGLPTYVPA